MTFSEMQDLIAELSYLNWEFKLSFTNDVPWLQVRFDAADLVTGDDSRQHGRKWLLSFHMTKTEIVTTAWKAVLTAVEHEAREGFRFRGKAVFGPHFDVEKMWELTTLDNLDMRTGEWVKPEAVS